MVRDISIIGPLNLDLIIIGDAPKSWEKITKWDGPADIEIKAAGSIGYTSQNLARLGLVVKAFSIVPDDLIGSFIIDSLSSAGVDASGILRVSGTQAGIAAYMLLFSNRKRPLAYRLPSHHPWPPQFDNSLIEDILSTRAIFCGGYLHFKEMWHGQTVEIFANAKGRGILTILDPQFPLFDMQEPWIESLHDILPYVDLFLCDENEAFRITHKNDLKEAAYTILDCGPSAIAIKQSANGSSIFTKDDEFHQAPFRFSPFVDSIGAGDAYDAAFVWGLLKGWPLKHCALAASYVAGKSTTGMGGSSIIPKIHEVEQVIQGFG